MAFSRRSFFQGLGLGAALTSLKWRPLLELHASPRLESSRSGETDDFIHLDRNENPHGPSPKVREAICSAVSAANRYAASEYNALLDAIARSHRVKSEQVALGCGSTELLRAAATAFLGPGKKLVAAVPTFEAMEYYARAAGAAVVGVPLTKVFTHDLRGMRARIDESTGLVYICNPNNPTASLTPRGDIEAFLAQLPTGTYVVIDEAYHHYAGESAMYASFINRPVANDRVIVTRTFSQIYGLAGLRLGYAVAAPRVIQRMRAAVTQDSINTVVARLAEVALRDTAGISQFVEQNENDRQEFFNQATARMLKPIDSHTNFVMLDAHQPADSVIQHFRNHRILLGPKYPSMPTFIRISLGTATDMNEFWRVWDLMPLTDMPM